MAPNRGKHSDVTRLYTLLEYRPTWITTSDRVQSDAGWLARLSRIRQIFMRDYVHLNHVIKLPGEDVPLFNRRPGEPDPEAGVYGPHIPLELGKCTTWPEQHLTS